MIRVGLRGSAKHPLEQGIDVQLAEDALGEAQD
jgi:hypothetical protein